MCFSKYIKDNFSEHQPFYKEIEKNIKEHKEYHINEILTSNYKKSKRKLLGQNGIIYIQRLLLRSKYLSEGIIQELNSKRTLNSYVLLRAHFETTGALAYFFDRLNSFYNGNINFERLNEVLFSLFLGSKDKKFKKKNDFIPDAENVLNLIDRIDKILGFNKEKKHREAYEHLCEFAHPNFLGTIIGSKTEKEKIKFNKKPKIDKTELGEIIPLLNITLKSFFHIYDKTFSLLYENENIKDIIL